MTGIRTALVTLVSTLLITLSGVAFAPQAAAASLVEVTNFGSNPGGMRMHVYVPNSHPATPAVVVAMHGCGGSGPGFYASSEFAALADRYGFIVIYPSAEQQAGFGNCFDTWSDAAKHRGGGSDPVSIVSMVTYVEQHYGGDPNRVFATGSSSGGMMTNEMLALYPDVFKAGAAFMGVPFNCFANAADYPPGSSKCTGGSMNRTPQQWGDAVRQAYPGYSGPRPRMQLWHGTADPLVPYSLLQEEIKQWTNVFGLSQTPTSTDSPQPGWDRRRYADSAGTVQVEAYSIQGAGHSLPATGMAAYAVAFFGLTGSDNPPPGSGSCRVTDTVNAWNNGLTESITITNTGTSVINGWSLVFTLPNGQAITSGWNATYSPSSGQVTARDATHNAMIAPNASITIGFQATHTGNTGKPTSFTLNGMSCAAV
ncbi:extracellular catalytic domain type 1 short-chain-length polyhydroxyalkanoate depolymerase [Kutzneria kofuensis]|uniref:Poly(Hydroxyalkanoate) depolymerase family esterase n=1 Tax=Kutzneria kofuensis TaxID=103725 RepID=A0A7W9NMN9_9PSEU|nr:PHB depolymerase family esterase [Kutzneria kofuensis]MBB5898044.1 poly(hydroxyalkanoate) depolymerase family esterase [Kutzneria kofuensis]